MTDARLIAILLAHTAIAHASAAGAQSSHWIEPGARGALPAFSVHENFYGQLGVLNASGAVGMEGHPFFAPLGANGRACVSCHQPAYAMSLSVAAVRERWRITRGKDPIFAALDGSNCPHHARGEEGSHSLLLERGLFRVSLPWPPKNARGDTIEPEFTLEVVRDPTGCNTHPQFGLRATQPTRQPMVSVYRRPRPVANLKYAIAHDASVVRKGAAAIDPETGDPVALNLLADARHPTLNLQAIDAANVHLQMRAPLTVEQQRGIVNFATQVFVAQSSDRIGGDLREGSDALTPQALALGRPGVVGDSVRTPVFGTFNRWRANEGASDAQRFRASVARGNEVFLNRSFWIRDAMHVSDRLGNPTKGSCATCHTMHLTGMEMSAGWVDVGTTNVPWANESPELPLFKITCDAQRPPHPFLGRTIYTQDPGRALITGKCADVGAIVIQQLRGMTARAPYFSNGAASNFREVVDFYDRRFNIRFTEREKQDLVNFLSVL